MTDATQHVVAPAAATAPQPQQIDLAKYIAHYIALRNKVKAIKEEHKAQLAPYVETMAKIEALVGNHLSATNASSMKTTGGTAYESITASASIKDPVEFQGFVIANRAWDFIDWKCNVTAAQDFLKEHKELPPGVAITPFRKINFRSPGKDNDE
jgi:hypothetical protein